MASGVVKLAAPDSILALEIHQSLTLALLPTQQFLAEFLEELLR